jgi:hypothetical protein
MKCLLYAVIVLLVLLSGGTSAADPIAVTSGSAVFTDDPGGFRIAGTGFDVDVVFAPSLVSGTHWFDHCASGCAPGTAVDFGTTTYTFAESFDGLRGTVGGVEYPHLFRTGQVTFTGPRIVLPLVFPEPGAPNAGLLGEFTFHGNVSIFDDEFFGRPPIFSSELTGRGTARVFAAPISSDRFLVQDLEYTFTPVPEPSTLAMLVPGVIGVATVLRRRRS